MNTNMIGFRWLSNDLGIRVLWTNVALEWKGLYLSNQAFPVITVVLVASQ